MPEIVVQATPEAAKGQGLDRVRELVEENGGEITRILQGTGDGGQREFHRITGIEGSTEELQSIAEQINLDDDVAGAYYKPDPTPPISQDLSPEQGYLDWSGSGGLNAMYTRPLSGGSGQNVKVVDVEGGWQFSHLELNHLNNTPLTGVNFTAPEWYSHGTQVLGVLGAKDNGTGVTGIVPSATIRVSSHRTTSNSFNFPAAVQAATAFLSAGDVMLIEVHYAGPRYSYQSPDGQRGYIAAEWFPDNYEALKAATNKGIIVVAAAGNGYENLDDSLYDTKPSGFPSNWVNPFRRTTMDAGTILVGAGYPGKVSGFPQYPYPNDPPASKADFSNYGSIVDVQAWGYAVVTTATDNPSPTWGSSPNDCYTGNFSGTSSASALVAGIVANFQSTIKGANKTALTPAQIRSLVRSTGTPQTVGREPTTKRIGNQIDLRAMVNAQGIYVQPTVSSFSYEVIQTASGKQIRYTWATTNAEKVTFNGLDVTGLTTLVGSYASGTHTLTATNGDRSASRTVTVATATALKVYEGNPALNFSTYLDNAGFAKSEVDGAVTLFSSNTKSVDNVAVLRTGNIGVFDTAVAEIDMCLAVLDRTGDLRFLDRVAVLIAAAHSSLATDWIKKPDGTESRNYATYKNNASLRQVGKKRWNFLWDQRNIGSTSSDYYGIDYPASNRHLLMWHASYANAALAFQNNSGKSSPGSHNYTSITAEMKDYLINHFEASRRGRSLVRPAGAVGAGGLAWVANEFFATASRARWHRAMYQLFGREEDQILANLVAGWVRQLLETKPKGTQQVTAWPKNNKFAEIDSNVTPREPYEWEPLQDASATVSSIYHLKVMGQDGFDDALLSSLTAASYWVYWPDGSKNKPAYDVGGGGAPTLGTSATARAVMRFRDATTVGTTSLLTEGAVAAQRWDAVSYLNYGFTISLGYADETLSKDFYTVWSTNKSTTRDFLSRYLGLTLRHLSLNKWVRPDAVTDTGGGDEDVGGGEDDDGTELDPGEENEGTDPENPDGSGGEQPTPEQQEPPVLPNNWPEPLGEEAFVVPTEVDSLGLIVYGRNWSVLDRVVGGGGHSRIVKNTFTIDPSRLGGLCKSATVEATNFLNVPPMAHIQILVNGVPRFLGRVQKPPQPRIRRFSPEGDPITLRTKYYYQSSKTGEVFEPTADVGAYESLREVVKRQYESNPGLALPGETEEYETLPKYDIEGLKSLADATLLFNRSFENTDITSMVKNIAIEFCGKHNLAYVPDQIDNFSYISVKQEFDNVTVQAAMDTLAQLAGDVVWGVDAYGRFFFHERIGKPVANYYLDRDPVNMESLEISAENVVNAVVVSGPSFAASGKELRSGYVIDRESIAEYGRIEASYDLPSAVSEVGVPAFIQAIVLEKPRNIPIYTGVGWEQSTAGQIPGGNLPDENYIVGVQDEVYVRDDNFASYAILPGDETDGTQTFIDSPGWTSTIYFEPQYANKLTIVQGESDTAVAATPETDAILTGDGLKYLSPSPGYYLQRARGKSNIATALSIYNEGKLVWSGQSLGPRIEANFEKQLVTKLTLVFDTPPSSGKVYWREVALLLTGKNDLVRYAELILRSSKNPTVTANFTYPPDLYFDPGYLATITDWSGLSFNYEVGEVTYTFENGVKVEGKVGRGQASLQRLLTFQKQAAEAAQKRLSNIGLELERRTRVLADYTQKVNNGIEIIPESWMGGALGYKDAEETNQPLEEIAASYDANVAAPGVRNG